MGRVTTPKYELQIEVDAGRRLLCQGVDSIKEAKRLLAEWADGHSGENIGYVWGNSEAGKRELRGNYINITAQRKKGGKCVGL